MGKQLNRIKINEPKDIKGMSLAGENKEMFKGRMEAYEFDSLIKQHRLAKLKGQLTDINDYSYSERKIKYKDNSTLELI